MFYKSILTIATTTAITAAAMGANAAEPAGKSYQASKGPGQTAGLVWRCGKNNPAMWGTFGNGCLKQKRKAKKKSSASANTSLSN